MITLTHPETGYRIHAPVAGTTDWFPHWEAFRARSIFGLDVETTGLEHDSTLRLIQVASETEAWVFNVADSFQVAALDAMFRRTSVRFVSHTSVDPRTIARTLGIDISPRCLDTWVNA